VQFAVADLAAALVVDDPEAIDHVATGRFVHSAAST